MTRGTNYSVFVVGFVIFFISIHFLFNRSFSSSNPLQTFNRAGIERTVKTAKGLVTWKEIEKNVFVPMGYSIKVASEPIPSLRHLETPTCQRIFSDWLQIATSYIPKKVVPKEMDSTLKDEHTLNGYAQYNQSYYNNLSTYIPQIWNMIETWMNHEAETFVNYARNGGMTIYHAMQFHRLDQQSGFVIGSLTPWVEVFALKAGAAKVLTVEYQNTTIIGTDKVNYIHPLDFAKQFESLGLFDFAASFSSMEHSGLERYGDPADPIGDIREVLKIRCMLKKGGILFLGLPREQDAVSYNELRVYGRIRLALMFTGFELLNVFRGTDSTPAEMTSRDFEDWTNWTHDTFVLRKL